MSDWLKKVRDRARLGKPPVSGGRSEKFDRIGFDDLIFAPPQLSGRPVDYFREDISTTTIIGKNSKNPLQLKMPIMIAAMSFGALSKSAKIAFAKASAIAGTCANTGEGGMLKEERKEAKLLIAQYSTGRFGVDEAYLKSADAIEVKIGQGAKPNQGGLLPADKVTEEIARVRNVPMGKAVHSPPYHPDIKNIGELKKRIAWLKNLTGKPVILKIAATDIENDVGLAVKANPDVIAIDGHAGGTGAAPEIMLNEFGLPTLPALVRARKVMDRLEAGQDLIIGGGINTGADIAKCLALGADAVFLGFAMMVAIGCTYCKLCYLGKCPVGITTQDPNFEKKFPADAVERAANFLKACNEEVKMVSAAFGHKEVHKLDRKYLRSMTSETEKITGIPLV